MRAVCGGWSRWRLRLVPAPPPLLLPAIRAARLSLIQARWSI
jgi:hypothetical protein